MTDPQASDGLPARRSQSYAREKLDYVSKYQHLFATGMKNRWRHRAYIDLMAGPGKCVETSGAEFDGSPLLSEREEFTQRIFVEEDASLAAALRQRASSSPLILEANCNAPATITRIRSEIPIRDALSFAFADNLGMDVTFETIRTLSEGRALDFMIVVQVNDLTRNVAETVAGRHDRRRLDAFFGTPGWEAVARNLQSLNTQAADIASALLQFYCDQLGTIGYHHVAPALQVMKTSTNVPLYRLVLATKHPKGVEFFRKIEKISPRGQRRMEFD